MTFQSEAKYAYIMMYVFGEMSLVSIIQELATKLHLIYMNLGANKQNEL